MKPLMEGKIRSCFSMTEVELPEVHKISVAKRILKKYEGKKIR